LAHIGKRNIQCQFAASGTKQVKLRIARYDNDQLRELPLANDYLARTARLLRDMIAPAELSRLGKIDNSLRLVQGRAGPFYVLKETVLGMGLRRVGNVFFTREFAHALFTDSMLCRGSVRGAVDRATLRYQEAGGQLASLLPQRRDTWERLVEDVYYSPRVEALLFRCMQQCEEHTEMQVLSMDCTMRVCMGLLAQATYRHARAIRCVQALPAEEALHAVCTVRGRTGAVVAIQPVHTESAEELANVLRRSLTDAQRAQVEFVAVDDVSHRLHAELLNVLPNMKGLVLDTMHLCMKYEQEPAP
jgi:hypothetical protein